MRIHNGKLEEPKQNGLYLTFKLHEEVVCDKPFEFVTSVALWYDTEDGWGKDVQFWAEMPTVDELKGVAYVQDTKG